MNKPKWGAKRQCLECGAHFYDLKRTKVVCPKCNAPFKSDAQPKAKRAIATPVKAEPPAPVEESAEKRNGTGMSAEDKALKKSDGDIPEKISPDADDDDKKEKKDENAFEDASELGEDDMAKVIDGSRKTDEG